MFYPLDLLDSLLFFLPAWLRVSLWGFVSGAVTMLLYDWLSPQDRISEIKKEVAETRERLNSYTGKKFSELWRRMKAAFAASFKQMKLMFFPTMLAALPVIIILLWMEKTYTPKGQLIEFGPAWLTTWYVIFLVTISISAIVTKVAYDID